MKIYKKYLFNSLLKPFLLSFFILTGIIWLTRVINYLSYLTEYNANFLLFVNLIILAIPSLLPLITIISLIISIINTYNKLLSNNELVILKNAGLSKKKLIEPIILFSFILSLLCFFTLSYLTPYANKGFENIKDRIYSDILNTAFNENNFINIDNITFYTKKRSNNKLESVIVSIKNEKDTNTIYAKEAVINKNVINFNNGNIYINGKNRNSIIYFDEYNFNLSNFYNKNKLKNRPLDTLNINELLKTKIDKNNKRTYTKYLNQIYSKISMSVLCFAIGIFSGALILNKSFSRMSNSYTAIISILSVTTSIVMIYTIKNGSSNIHSIYISNILNVLIIMFSVINLKIKK